MADLKHHDDYGYPHFQQFQAQVPYALKIVTGQAADMDLGSKAKTLHTVGSFALGIVLPHTESPMTLANMENMPGLAELDGEAKKAFPMTGVQGIDWLGIFRLVLKFLQDLVGE